MSFLLPVFLLLAASPVALQDSRPSADELVQEAWQLLPSYSGAHRPTLSIEVGRDVRAAIHLLEAATTLEPDHLRGLWSLGHAHVLAGEDQRNRGHEVFAREHYRGATKALGHSLELAPTDPWAAYARGAAHTAFGEHGLALKDLELAVANADALLNEVGEPSDIAWLRFKALEWRCEVLMRARQHDAARTALATYHGAFSSNAWPLQIALAENHGREWNLGGMREDYQRAIALFPDDHQAHALLGHVEGLLGHAQLGVEHLQRAIGLELNPGLYTRLWLVILAEGDVQKAARADLGELLANPPSSFAAWDLGLGQFLLGACSPADFVTAGQAELERRIEAGENTDDLMCEVYFYSGLRAGMDWEGRLDGEALNALDYYRLALKEMPLKWKWEWAYSRLYLARELQGETITPGFTIDGEQYRGPEVKGSLSRVHWSVPQAPRTVTDLKREMRPGDLLLATVLDAYGERVLVTRVVGAN